MLRHVTTAPGGTELRIRPTRAGRLWLATTAVVDAVAAGALSFLVLPPRLAAVVLGVAVVAAVVRSFRVSLRLGDGRVEVVNRFRSYVLRLDEVAGFDEGRIGASGPPVVTVRTTRPSLVSERQRVRFEATATNDPDRLNAWQDGIAAWLREARRLTP